MSERFVSSGPGIGARAPALAVSGVEREPRRGEPCVLAFVGDGLDDAGTGPAPGRAGHAAGTALAAIRRELRGLGAALRVVSPAGVWVVRADDALEPLATASDQLAAEVAEAARRYGLGPGDDAVFVIDGRGVVRFEHRIDRRDGRRGGAVWPTLARAIALAGGAVHARQGHAARQRVLFTRREWVVTSLVVGCAAAFLPGCKEPRAGRAEGRAAAAAPPADLDVTLTVNGTPHQLALDPRTSLLDALRERLGLTGTKKGCDAGQCGACTVLVGGKRVTSCLTLAVMAQGREITTIEGLARGGALHPLQRAFIEHDGLQCGYCTPGQILSAVALLAEGHARTDDEIRDQMSGNLCRCGAYPNIIAAIQAARRARG